jgi:hypothetical protein
LLTAEQVKIAMIQAQLYRQVVVEDQSVRDCPRSDENRHRNTSIPRALQTARM